MEVLLLGAWVNSEELSPAEWLEPVPERPQVSANQVAPEAEAGQFLRPRALVVEEVRQ